MATHLEIAAIDKSETLGADVVDHVLLIPVDMIDEGDRLRPVDPAWAQALGDLMRREGQKKSIEVCREPGANRWTLVDGAHRLTGARGAGIVYLRAEVVSADQEDRRLREISAQLWHRGLNDPFERASFIAELVAIKRARAGLAEAGHRAASVPTRWKKAIAAEADDTLETISNVYGWSNELGAQLGLTGRTVRNDLTIYRRISPSLIAKLRRHHHPVATNATQLRALAKLEEREQREVVELLTEPGRSLGHPVPKSVTEAIAHPYGPRPAKRADPAAARLSTFLSVYQRMSLTERKAAAILLSPHLPAGLTLSDGGSA